MQTAVDCEPRRAHWQPLLKTRRARGHRQERRVRRRAGGTPTFTAMSWGIATTLGLPVPILHSPKAIVLLVPSVIEASFTVDAEPFAGR